MQSKKFSLNTLNWLNFFAADVATGLGPFIAVYLAANLHWNPAQIGIAVSAMSLSTVLAQSPAGYLIDKTVYKRLIVLIISVVIAIGGIGVLLFPTFYPIISSQIVIGIASAFFIPSLIALAMSIGGAGKFDKTISTNQTFNHAGNVISAVLIGVAGHYTNNAGIFYGLVLFCIGSSITAMLIREKDINHQLANSTTKEKGNKKPPALKTLLINKPFLILLIVSVMFHFANAAMLPLVGQELGKSNHTNAALYMSACIVIAQLIMVPVSLLSGKLVKKGRKGIMLFAFAVLPVRGFLYTLSGYAGYLVGVQILDGVAAGIFGVVSIIMVSDLFSGSGYDNFAQGILATAVGLGASLSNMLTGYIVNLNGFNTGFITLAILAAIAFLIFWLAMPDTLECRNDPTKNKQTKLTV